ncbi:MAG: catalase [Pseudomonadota bacterium]
MLKTCTFLTAIAAVPMGALADDDYTSAKEDFEVFESTFGVTEGKRRNHTKGFCFVGVFSPVDPAILAYTNSPIFKATSEVNGRVSHKGGNNLTPDNTFSDRGLAFDITTPEGGYHIINMNTEDFFPASNPSDFIDLLRTLPKGGDAVKALAAERPELAAYLKHHKQDREKVNRPYEGTTFNSVNAFYLVNDAGERTAVRWSMVPTTAQSFVVPESENFLMENMNANIAAGDVAWDMVVTIANPGDDPDNAAVRWTGEHTKITAARLTVLSTATEAAGDCDAMNYDPTVLSDGFETSDDPVLEARSQIYAHGVGVRLGEK